MTYLTFCQFLSLNFFLLFQSQCASIGGYFPSLGRLCFHFFYGFFKFFPIHSVSFWCWSVSYDFLFVLPFDYVFRLKVTSRLVNYLTHYFNWLIFQFFHLLSYAMKWKQSGSEDQNQKKRDSNFSLVTFCSHAAFWQRFLLFRFL